MGDGTGAAGQLPLDGLRVIEFSNLLPGAWCTQMLGDLGAEIIKVERPEIGDPSRHNPPLYEKDSIYFNSVNRNKRSVSLNMARPEGREVAQRLIRGADAMIENFRLGGAAKLEIDYDRARALNPAIVYCSLSGYGRTGPMAEVAGHDLVIQCMSGLLGARPADGNPTAMPTFLAGDYCGATMATIGILSALLRRKETGAGCFIDLSMLESVLSMSTLHLSAGLATLAGQAGDMTMPIWGGNPRFELYQAQDGRTVGVTLLETGAWKRFCDLVGRPDLINPDEKPEDRHSDHGERAPAYRKAIADYIKSKPFDALIRELDANDIAICPVLTPEEILTAPVVGDRGAVFYVDDPVEGRVAQIENPLAPSGMTDSRRRPVPTLGADNDAVLAELGYDDDARARLRADGIA
ncbi:MAG: CaiB/BaiF CoA transferase family protein [Alphaproteobacteria bacterium]